MNTPAGGVRGLLVAAAAALATTALGAQTTAPAYIVTRLGVDTVAVERYTRTSGRVEGDLALANRFRTLFPLPEKVVRR